MASASTPAASTDPHFSESGPREAQLNPVNAWRNSVGRQPDRRGLNTNRSQRQRAAAGIGGEALPEVRAACCASTDAVTIGQ
jgi:hypothetical protein